MGLRQGDTEALKLLHFGAQLTRKMKNYRDNSSSLFISQFNSILVTIIHIYNVHGTKWTNIKYFQFVLYGISSSLQQCDFLLML